MAEIVASALHSVVVEPGANKMGEKGLQEAKASSETVLQTLQDGLLVIDADGIHIEVNAGLCHMTGFARNELLGNGLPHPYWAPEDYDRSESALRHSLSGDPGPYELTFMRKNGERFPVLLSSAVLKDEHGFPVTSVAMVKDLTHLRRSQDTLQRSEVGFGLPVDALPMAVLVVGTRNRVEYCNRKFGEVFGYCQDDLQYLTDWWKAAYSDEVDRQQASSVWARAQAQLSRGQGEVLLGETTVTTRGGHAITVEVRCASVDNRSVLVFSDLSGHKRVEEALATERNRLRTLIDSLPHSVYVKDREGRFLAANAAQALATGAISSRALIGKRDFDFYPPELAARYWVDDLLVITSGKAIIDQEEPWVDNSGQERQMLITKVPLLDKQGDVVGLVGIGRDVTQQKKEQNERDMLRDQLLQSQKMEAVGQLTAGIAHDFNNLLTAMAGFAELMQLEVEPDDPLHRYAERILDSSQRAADLVQQLMVFSRREKMNPQIVSLNQTLDKMRNMLSRLISEDISIEMIFAPDLWPVKADPGHMNQVVINLVVNARDAMPQGGQLTIETRNVRLDDNYAATHLEVEPGDYVLLAVSDNGVGMSQEVKAHIFEPFFTTKERGKGTGLGLATVYGIVKQAGGDIWAYSEEGEGTTFKIYLPRGLREDAVTDRLPVMSDAVVGGDETLLLVEDSEEVRQLARTVLTSYGYNVLVAASGMEALSIAAAHPSDIHLLLTDVVMPGMNGKELSKRLATSRPAMRVLFMSGYTENAIARHGVLSPGTSFLQKPLSPRTLARKVRQMLDS